MSHGCGRVRLTGTRPSIRHFPVYYNPGWKRVVANCGIVSSKLSAEKDPIAETVTCRLAQLAEIGGQCFQIIRFQVNSCHPAVGHLSTWRTKQRN